MAYTVDPLVTYPDDSVVIDWLFNDWNAAADYYGNFQGNYIAQQHDTFFGVGCNHGVKILADGRKSIAVMETGSEGGAELTRVTTDPAPDEYRVNMDAIMTGRIQFNPARDGEEFIIKYVSSGTVSSIAVINFRIAHFTIPNFDDIQIFLPLVTVRT